eukprot:TRINITY_DN8023_c0_g2_i1.p1 TRINITY_DN8023_c0_g2~~TRINITY_DN8023_c0_g2_i1.p1  ORF type:complete len:559 (-),score=67.02 TRINITY_DN8023_c0_g2_i1:108-1784(-)
MDRVVSMQSIPLKKERKADSISLILGDNEVLDEREENDNAGAVWIKKEKSDKWKERNLILFEKKCLVVLKAFDQKPENIFFLEACTVSMQNGATFLLQDHVHKADYVIKVPPKKSGVDTMKSSFRINESIGSSATTLFTTNSPTIALDENIKLPPVLESLKSFCEDLNSLNNSGNHFDLKETTSFVKPPSFDHDIQVFGFLPKLLKMTLSYPWSGVLEYLPWVSRFIMLANLALLTWNLVNPDNLNTLVWNFPVLVYTAYSIYNHFWITKTLKSRHFEYLFSTTIARKRVLGLLKKFTILGIVAVIIVDSIFLVAMLADILLQPWNIEGILSVFSSWVLFWLHLPSTVISFIIFAFITKMHKFALLNISKLTKRMVSNDNLSLSALYVHLLHQNIMIQKTAKRSVGLFFWMFIVFTFFFVLGVFHITRVSLPQDLAPFLLAIMEIVVSFIILLLLAIPVSSLNASCDEIFRQISFLSNFNVLLSQGQERDLDNIEEGLNNSAKGVNISRTLEFSLMVERMNLGLVILGVRITYNWVFFILFIFGGISVFIGSESSLLK